MGNFGSKKTKVRLAETGSRAQRIPNFEDLIMEEENEGRAISQRKYDEMEVRKLKKELLENPQIFVLNNLLMSIQFFENFDREKQRFMHSATSPLEKELNPTLLRDETIECIIPDVIFESVNNNVRFRRLHGANKFKTEPLAPRRFFVVNDNIEVLECKHTPHYSAIDKPSYQVVLENSSHSGYVQLKCTLTQPRLIVKAEEKVGKQIPQPGPSTQPDSNEDYEYTTITNINTPKPLNITSYERRDTLPKSCFTVHRVKKYDQTSDDEDDEYEDSKPPSPKEFYDNKQYISSDGFMNYFKNAVFPHSLGLALGFDLSEINLAKAIPGKIFCNLQDVDEDFPIFPCEIVPSVAIQWPVDLTWEFHERSERPIMWDKFREEYKWPNDSMVKDISSLSCVLIPRGYTPKRDKNPDCDIEWEVGFPKAQRYLDIHMSHTQVRAFLFLLSIYKSYIEPVNKRYDGVLIDHIRTHMYYECESNPRDWPEHRLGTKMVLVIKSLIKKLSIGELPDFFIKKKNMFLNVPNKHLTYTQKVFHNVLENPAIYFIGALRNLKYTNSKFYPTPDFKKLYTILTVTNALLLINPRLYNSLPPNLKPKNRRPAVKGDANYRKEIKWQYEKEKRNREKYLQKIREQNDKIENLKLERKGSVDSIDCDCQCEKKFDLARMREILIFFIEHFIEMAKHSRRLATQRQVLFFLKQSSYLCKILQEFGLELDAGDYINIITKEEETSKKLSITEAIDLPPSTPKRNSAQFNWELTQQVKSNNINLHNLNVAYNNVTITHQNSFSKLKKPPSNLKSKSSFLRNIQSDDRRISVEGGTRRSVVEFSDNIEIR